MASDYEIALRLQNELNGDFNILPPSKKSKKEHTSIIDSEWEKLDPNPDIYVLFQTFDKKFFWGKLESVEVKWSKRMYSCAGVCSYKGKRGGCCISLSLPLLQLRPRKDLVETLLHEMIHAYLFLTANKQDREEHGPQFHEHMNRINKAAGTKITVYHTFHDEVAHYRQHWWRCNGPCQNRKPFFGLVKRSMNRAPGPNDFWFAEHQSTCGGEFIKIKEPENFKARKSKNKVKETSLLTTFTNKSSESSSKPNPKVEAGKKIKKKEDKTDNENLSSSKILPLTDYFQKLSSPSSEKKPATTNENGSSTENNKLGTNIHGFSSLKNKSSTNSSILGDKVKTIKPSAGFGAGLKSNKGGTLVMNPKPSSSTNNDKDSCNKMNTPEKQKITPFSGVGHVLAPGSRTDRSKSKLLTMFEHKAEDNSSVNSPITSEKNKKEVRSFSFRSENKISTTVANGTKVSSPNKANDNEKHSTSDSVSKNTTMRAGSSGILASKKVEKKETVVISSDSEEETKVNSEDIVNCPVCGFQTFASLINEHLDECTGLQTIMDSVQINNGETEFEVPNRVKCPSCGFMCLEEEINLHLDACLS